MDGQNYVVFHNDGNDSYMNSTANFKGADVGTTFIDLYFSSISVANNAGYDKVRLTVTATKEEQALEDVGAAMAGAKNPVTVIADDVNGNYVSDHVTAVSTITLASQVQTRVVEAIATTKSLEASDSGKIFTVDQGSAYSITLPTVAQAGAGWHATFFLIGQASNAVEIIPDASEDTLRGAITSADGSGGPSAETGVDQLIFVSGTAKNGDRVDIVCTGSFFECSGVAHDNDHITLA